MTSSHTSHIPVCTPVCDTQKFITHHYITIVIVVYEVKCAK
jgi:hypothetical protein